MTFPVVVVLAATGSQGKAIIQAVSKLGKYEIRGLTRDVNSEKAQEIAKYPNVTLFNTNDMKQSFQGASVVFAYSHRHPNETEEMKAAADMAQEAGVELFVFSGLPGTTKESNGKHDVPHYERKKEVEKYLDTLPMKTIVVQLGAFCENFKKLNYVKLGEDGKLSLVLQTANLDTNLAMTYVDKDVGQSFALILENYKENEKLFERPIPIISYRIPFGQHLDIFKKVTGRKDVEPIIVNTFPVPELQHMREFLDDCGNFANEPVPDPRLTEIGFKPHSFEDYIRNELLPLPTLDI